MDNIFGGGKPGFLYSRNDARPGGHAKTPVHQIVAANSAATVTETPKVILPNDPRRRYLFIQNRGIQNVYITYGVEPEGGGANFPAALEIPPGGFYEPQSLAVPTNQIWAATASGTQNITIVQGVIQ